MKKTEKEEIGLQLVSIDSVDSRSDNSSLNDYGNYHRAVLCSAQHQKTTKNSSSHQKKKSIGTGESVTDTCTDATATNSTRELQ